MIHLFDNSPGTDGMIPKKDQDVGPGFGLWALALLVLATIACCVAGCKSGPTGLPSDAYQAEADAVVVLAFGADPVFPDGDGNNPNPNPDDDRLKPGDKCPNYSGSGRCKSGDGIGDCGTCGGDGRIDREDLLSKPSGVKAGTMGAVVKDPVREIVMHVTEKNRVGWPQTWWPENSECLEDAGYVVSVVLDEPSDEPKEPWFEVFRGDTRHVLNREELEEMVK